MSCRVEGISPRGGVPEDPSVSLSDLAQRGIDPESFHSENPDRFQGVGTCSPTQIQTYSRFQDLLGERISQMPASTIAETLERLYRQAYLFDAATGEMTLGTGAVPQQAKRELDLWIAAIDHRALATALGLFGMATVINGGPGADQEWTPGTLTSSTAHEASHIEWFRENFDRFPDRLLWAGVNERRAYAVTLQTGELYQSHGLAGPDEVQALASQATFLRNLLETTNEAIGLDRGELDPLAWNDDWDLQETASLAFQPPSLLQATQEEAALRGSGVREPSRGGLEGLWHRSFVGANFLTLPNARDRREALRALSALQSATNTPEGALFYVRSHPLTQVVNLMRQSIGLPPLPLLAPTRSEWETFKTDWARQAFWFERRLQLHSLPPQKNP